MAAHVRYEVDDRAPRSPWPSARPSRPWTRRSSGPPTTAWPPPAAVPGALNRPRIAAWRCCWWG